MTSITRLGLSSRGENKPMSKMFLVLSALDKEASLSISIDGKTTSNYGENTSKESILSLIEKAKQIVMRDYK